MSLASLPKMLLSETEGWTDLVRIHPSVAKMMVLFVAPMSLLPPLMYAYAQMVQPGSVFPLVEPPLSGSEISLVGAAFFIIELMTVALMASYIRQLGDYVNGRPAYADAFMLATVAPTPLWLSSLALFLPSLWLNILVVAIAWIGSAALIRHGIRPLFKLEDAAQAHRVGNAITFIGVAAWVGLMVVLALLLSLAMGWR